MIATTIERCKVCDNKGYRPLIFMQGDKKQESMMFCKCELGQKLNNLTKAFRLEDLKSFANEILPKLKEIQENLYSPSEVGRLLQNLRKDIEQVVKDSDKK